MATKIYDLAVKIGKYVGSDGKEKGRWQNVGAIMQTDDGGKFIMMAKWFNPAGVPDLANKGGDSILLSMFPPKDREYGDEVPTRQVSMRSRHLWLHQSTRQLLQLQEPRVQLQPRQLTARIFPFESR